MDPNALVTEEIEAGAEFIRELEKAMSFRAAFWIKPADSGSWRLYVAADQANNGDLRPGYTEILKVNRSLKNPNLNSRRIRLIGSNDPLARAVLDLAEPYDGRLPVRYDGDFFGGMSIEGSYFYPLPNTTALGTP